MLEPKDRLLLLEALRPPIGFRFDEGIGTTYTLDLVALLTAPLAFTWFDQKDDPRAGESVDSLEVVESLRRYSDKLTLFCHAGRISIPKAHYPQLAFLEQSIVECLPESKGAFHPKVWVLRFRADEGTEVRYRMLCLSRNLTFSRAWDLLLSMDGVLGPKPVRRSRGLAEFVRALPAQAARTTVAEDVSRRIELLAGEVERVEFEPPDQVSDFTFHPIGIGGWRRDPLKALRETKRLLVVSPFLAASQLNELADWRSEMWVVSTASQLEALATKPTGKISYYTLKERLRAEAEDDDAAPAAETEAIELSDLHAKLYVTETGAEAHVWTGSANATLAAFDRNVEFLVELVGHRKQFGIDAMMQPEKGQVRFINLLEPADDIVARAPEQDDVKALERRLDDLRSALAGAGLEIHVTRAGSESFNLEVQTASTVEVPEGIKASCWPSAVSTAGVAFGSVQAGEMLARFPSVSLQGVTAFLAFRLSGTVAGETREVDFVLTLPLVGAPEGRREQVLRSLVKDRGRMLRFLWLLLADEVADVPQPMATGNASDSTGAPAATSAFAVGGLFEVLLRNLDRSPERLDYLHGLIAELRANESEPDLFPDGFDAIWLPIWNERLRQKEAVAR